LVNGGEKRAEQPDELPVVDHNSPHS
jgi:hypothetical protein